MREILFMPIEPIEERYSLQWLMWFRRAFNQAKRPFEEFGNVKVKRIKDGEFLDSAYTNMYKLKQAHEVCSYIDKNRDKSFTVFCLDAWNPCLVNIAYMRDTLGIDIKIKSMIHAGSYDENDFLYKKRLDRWARGFERSLYQLHDEIFVATDYHSKLFSDVIGTGREKFTKVDWPVFTPNEKDIKPWEKKEDIVVYPHRMAEEKRPDLFTHMAKAFRETNPQSTYRFLFTVEHCDSKNDYYEMLNNSKYVVSFAEQETFGIAMQEAINYGCIPICRKGLSYDETIDRGYLFDDLYGACDLLADLIKAPRIPMRRYSEDIDWIWRI